MLCQYGANNIFLDVTEKVQHYFIQKDRIIFPEGPKLFNEYFTDPIEGTVKQLIIYLSDNRVILINENDLQAHKYEITRPIITESLNILEHMTK